MATVQDTEGWTLADASGSAREFVQNRLDETDSPMAPAELAEEYGCGNPHMQNTCYELAKLGLIERIREGQYIGSTDKGGTDRMESVAETASSEPGSDPSSSVADGGSSGGSDDRPSQRDEAIVAGATTGATILPAVAAEIDARKLLLAGCVLLLVYIFYVRGGGAEPAQEDSGSEERLEVEGGMV